MKIFVKRSFNSLVPTDKGSEDYIYKLDKELTYEMNIKIARNYQFHKKLFSLFNLGFENTGTDMPFDVYRKVQIMKAGYFKAYNTGKGIYYEPLSLAFDKMTQNTFDEMYIKIRTIIANSIGVTNEELELQILEQY